MKSWAYPDRTKRFYSVAVINWIKILCLSRDSKILILLRYYLPHEMVMSKVEKASLHANEIFITQTTDWIDVETIQMKAAIFHTKGFVGSIHRYISYLDDFRRQHVAI